MEIILTKGDGIDKIVTLSPIIKYEVWQCITTGNGIQGDNKYPILIDLISKVNNTVRIANNASATADASLKQTARMLEKVDNALIKVNNTISSANNAKDEALNAADEAKKAIAAGTQDLEVKNARGKYESLNERLNALDKDLLKSKEIGIIPVTTENNFVKVENTANGYLEDIKLEGKTLIVNSQNEEVEAGTEGATLKSVSDDVDEIVVSSVKGDGNLLDFSIYTTPSTSGTSPKWNLYFPKGLSRFYYKCILDDGSLVDTSNAEIILEDKQGNSVSKGIISSSVEYRDVLNNRLDDVTTVRIYSNNSFTNQVISNIIISDKPITDLTLQYKSDKKKVLYYDTETQTWNKPILREWDSIEEHSNGKYYYHKRSEENVLNGSENFQLYSQSLNDYLCFFIDIPKCLPKSNLICDKLKNVPAIYLESFVQEGICVHPTLNRFYIKVLKSKLSSPNVEGFKKWLQTNHITVIYKLAVEEVYECTPIDLISFESETNYLIESGPISPKSTFKCIGFIGNVISTLKEKVSYLEDKLYKTNLANFTVALNALDTKLKLEQLTKTPR